MLSQERPVQKLASLSLLEVVDSILVRSNVIEVLRVRNCESIIIILTERLHLEIIGRIRTVRGRHRLEIWIHLGDLVDSGAFFLLKASKWLLVDACHLVTGAMEVTVSYLRQVVHRGYSEPTNWVLRLSSNVILNGAPASCRFSTDSDWAASRVGTSVEYQCFALSSVVTKGLESLTFLFLLQVWQLRHLIRIVKLAATANEGIIGILPDNY